jgi:hypothetical protein
LGRGNRKETIFCNNVKDSASFFIQIQVSRIFLPRFCILGTEEPKIYEKFFEQVAIELILQKYQVSLLVVDINKEEIIKWTS